MIDRPQRDGNWHRINGKLVDVSEASPVVAPIAEPVAPAVSEASEAADAAAPDESEAVEAANKPATVRGFFNNR